MIEDRKNDSSYYFKINLSYEIPCNILDSEDSDVISARTELYEKLNSSIPDTYEKFSTKLVLYQLRDTFNYIVSYSSFFRSQTGLPMEEYVKAEEIKLEVQKVLEDFFDSVDCEYRNIKIKTFN